ncbi:MAG: amino acid permease [Nitrososphaerota archaeon]|nr:amino acid permease [Nitrososphaerota archaeon]
MPDGLKRVITLRYAVALYVSSVLGAGVLVIPGLAARAAGPGSLVAWCLLSVASYPFAYTFSGLSARNPESGGIYSFAREAFGVRAASLVAWLFVAWVVAGAPAISLAAGSYLASSLPMTRPETFLFAALLLLAAFLVNYRGIRFSGRIQLATVAVIVLVLSFAVAASSASVRASNFVPFLPEGPASVGVAAALIVWSFLGYENVSNVAGEFKDPKRDFHRSVAISVVLVSALYIAVAVVIVGTGAYRSGGGVTPFSTLMSTLLGAPGGAVISALAVVIIFSTVNAYTAGMARIIYAAAGDGSFPRALAKLDRQTGVPGRALLFLIAVTLGSLLVFYALDLGIQSAFLTTSGAAILTYVVGSAAGVRLLDAKGARRLLPWAALLASVSILPFIGVPLAVSLAIGLAGLAYSWSRAGRRVGL